MNRKFHSRTFCVPPKSLRSGINLANFKEIAPFLIWPKPCIIRGQITRARRLPRTVWRPAESSLLQQARTLSRARLLSRAWIEGLSGQKTRPPRIDTRSS
jgi:hypothetical protein